MPGQNKNIVTFQGFQTPNYTIVPDELFDELLTQLSGGELKALLYIIRRTFGFKKKSDQISLSQMLHGIITKDGRQLDHGIGISKPTLLQALRSLAQKGIIEAQRRQSARNGDEPTEYRLRFAEKESKQATRRPLVKKLYPPVVKKLYHPLVKKSTPQETDRQHTVKQQQQHVVALLTSKGIGKRIAQQLAKEHGEAYIRRKIDYLDFLLAVDSARIKNPKGWLRKAIEEDYGVPDNYKTAAEREKDRLQEQQLEKALAQSRAAHARKMAAEDERQQLEEKARLKEIRKQYETPAKLVDSWDGLIQRLEKTEGGPFLIHFLKRSVLAAVENGAAVIVVPGEVPEILTRRFKRRLERELKNDGLKFDNLKIVPWKKEPARR